MMAIAWVGLLTFAHVFLLVSCHHMYYVPDAVISGQLTIDKHLEAHGRRLSVRPEFEACLSKGPVKVTFVNQDNPAYEGWRQRTFNSLFLDRWPEYYLFPNTTEEVSQAVTCANKNNVPFTIRSGGHSYRALSLSPCGAVIDFYNMRSIDIHVFPAHRIEPTAVVGAGWRLGPLYWYITANKPKELAYRPPLGFPGGSCPSVGLTGLILSGGQGILTRKLGNTADSVLGATVVLTNGTIVHANNETNVDLYFALRGGSGAYGIVTEWKLQLHYTPHFMTHYEAGWAWSIDNLNNILGQFWNSKPWLWPDEFAEIRFYMEPYAAYPIRVAIFYWGIHSQMVDAMNNIDFFKNVQPDHVDTWHTDWADEQLFEAAFGDPTKKVTLEDMRYQEIYSNWGPKSFISTVFPQWKNDGVLPADGINVISNVFNGNPCATATLTFWGGQIMRNKYPSAMDDLRKAAAVIQVASYEAAGCPDPEDAVKQFWANISPYTTGTQYYGYVYDVLDGADPFEQFFGAQGPTLKKIKEKYDPDGLLNSFGTPAACNQPGGGGGGDGQQENFQLTGGRR